MSISYAAIVPIGAVSERVAIRADLPLICPDGSRSERLIFAHLGRPRESPAYFVHGRGFVRKKRLIEQLAGRNAKAVANSPLTIIFVCQFSPLEMKGGGYQNPLKIVNSEVATKYRRINRRENNREEKENREPLLLLCALCLISAVNPACPPAVCVPTTGVSSLPTASHFRP